MRVVTRALSRFVSCGALLLSSACMAPGQQGDLDNQDPHNPGHELGTFQVTGKLGQDDCGAESLNAPSKWSFEVKLSREGGTLYWLNGREAIVGDIDETGAFSFETHLDLPMSDAHGAVKGCTIVRTDRASGSVDSSLSATLSYSYDAKAGTECETLPLGSNGLPLTLPCSLEYSLSGSKQ